MKLQQGDLVIVINSDYNDKLIGCVGTVEQTEKIVRGHDKFGQFKTGYYLVVDMPAHDNRFGTTLWYFKSNHLIKISPDKPAKLLSKDSHHKRLIT